MIICTKVRYENRKLARKSLKKFKKIKGYKSQTIYACEHCNGFHLTSRGKQESRDYTRYLNKKK